MAAEVLAHWRADGLPERPTREALLHATREHDCGWIDEDDAPVVNPETGEPWDFIRLPAGRRQAVWPRALRLLDATPYQAALVAHHALTAYARYEDDPAWAAFFEAMTRERDSRVLALAEASGATFTDFLRDYTSLRTADLLSLSLCHGWQDRFEIDYYTGVPDGATLALTPDPFDGETVAWAVTARRIPRRPYASDDELRAAVRDAGVETLSGRLVGRPLPLPS